ncbi:uncharacterized protein LOC108608567 isoform X1 [Drosophila busckii]|uniref:uncharacterized protein LOC108608567 isoform X1 n=1 Tax=Drosophila busckii TaxID=30019 RepID=UPI00143347C2|nr:uncharacterized protein LOC108608567 isoform X1 [Drosophila busckii]
MAMHSYLRASSNPNQSQTRNANINMASSDEVQNFLKDKQAWEHAISLYQGLDPLDHWYNYICWYENHEKSDPELKFRETLERCLTVYEHNEYYWQDVRLVRLWLKYIAMQGDQLRFYQVLFQRGTGRQVAAFYIGWANYYEEREQFQDAEEVFNLAFQEKAQSHIELQNAHTKFSYVRSLHYQQQQHHHQQQQQHPTAPPPNNVLQHLTTYTQQQPYPQTGPGATSLRSYQLSQHTYHQYQQQHPPGNVYHHQSQSQLHPQPPPNIHPHSQEQQLQSESSFHLEGLQVQVKTPPHYEQHVAHASPQSALEPAAPSQANLQTQYPPNDQPSRPNKHINYQQQLETQMSTNTYTYPESKQQDLKSQVQQLSVNTGDIRNVRLPRNFEAFGRNNHETWKPALTLEEPEDPLRVCFYAKHLVYPAGAGIEYSPEELLARKYAQILGQESKQEPYMQISKQQKHTHTLKRESNYQSPDKDQSQELDRQINRSRKLYKSYKPEAPYYMTAVHRRQYVHNDDGEEGQEGPDEEEQSVEENSDEQSNEGNSDNESGIVEHANCVKQHLEQPTYEQQSRSIKIKFKKERTLESSSYSAYTIENIYHHQQDLSLPASPIPVSESGGETGTTSMRVAVPASAKSTQDWRKCISNVQRQRNGGVHFHPYLLEHTSTPKSNGNGCKRSRVKLNLGNSHSEQCNNSNSSCSVMANGSEMKILTGEDDSETADELRINRPIPNDTFNDNANFSFSSAGGGLDNSKSSLALAVGRLHFGDTAQTSSTNKALHTHNNNNNNNNKNTITKFSGKLATSATNNTSTDFSTFQENSYFATQHDSEAQQRRLAKALDTIERHQVKETVDPFNSELCRAFLTKLNFPGNDDAHASYKIVQAPLPKISNTRTLHVLEDVQFNIDKEVGRGSYGSVYKATDARTGNVMALKFQKPPNTWEIYICDQVRKRVMEPNILPGLMDISTAIIAPNASLIATEFSPFGSLLDINNKIRQATTKVMHESLVMHFSAQICNIVDHLHRQHIIHADIKPDNFLLMRVPNVDSLEPSLRLIDFGCAIDLSLFPNGEHTKFRKLVQTDGFTCIEMQEGRSWSFETDLFCIASTVHVMLFGEYMQPQKKPTGWDIRQKLPRYLKKHVWSKFFGDLLNMQPDKLPELQQMRKVFDEECYRMDSELQKQIRTLSNILHRR